MRNLKMNCIVTGLAVTLLMAMTMASSTSGEVERPVTLGTLRAADGRSVDLTPPKDGLTVVVFYSPECPISNAYSPTLAELSRAYPATRVKWAGICVDPELSAEDQRTHASDFGLKFPVILDRDASLARKLGATMTPEAFVIDSRGRIRYHGRIDDQFAARGVRNAHPIGTELKDAIAAVLAGRQVKTPHVPAVGCPILQPKPATPSS